MSVFKLVYYVKKTAGCFRFKSILYTMCATRNDGKRESVTVRGSRVWICRENNADVVNTILLSKQFGSNIHIVEKLHVCN